MATYQALTNLWQPMQQPGVLAPLLREYECVLLELKSLVLRGVITKRIPTIVVRVEVHALVNDILNDFLLTRGERLKFDFYNVQHLDETTRQFLREEHYYVCKRLQDRNLVDIARLVVNWHFPYFRPCDGNDIFLMETQKRFALNAQIRFNRSDIYHCAATRVQRQCMKYLVSKRKLRRTMDACPVCLEGLHVKERVYLPCHHFVCRQDMRMLLDREVSTCPQCRSPISVREFVKK